MTILRAVGQRASSALRAARGVWYRGHARHCSLCGGRFRRFLSAGVVPRLDARCPACDSLERHRYAAWLLQREGRIGAAGRTLHVAPEAAMVRLLASDGSLHVTGDLAASGVDVRFDIAHLPFAAGAFTLVYCSHVLEHVDDDGAAMREMRRVLAADGIALVQVPVDPDRQLTVENTSIRSPEERLRLFGQNDHVRAYGLDVIRRLREAGFDVRALYPDDVVPADQISRLGLDRTEPAFLCRPVADG